MKFLSNTDMIVFLTMGCFLASNAQRFHDPEGDPDLEAYLKEAIENFRDQMPVGIPEIKMPILDPLVLMNKDINVNENVATISLSLQEMTVRDLSKFNVQQLIPDLEDLFVKTSLSLPFVEAYGTYKLSGKLLKILPLFGEGNFQINLTNAAISGEGKLEFVEDTLQMTSLNLDLVWQHLDIELENFLGGGKFSDVLQKLLPKIGKGAFDNFRPDIMKLINKALLMIIGLSNFVLADIKANLEALYISVELLLPEIVVDGSYDLQGNIMTIFPLEGNGHLCLNASGIVVSGTGELQLANKTLQLIDLKLDLYLDNLSMDLENFMGGGRFSSVLQKVIPGLGREILLKYKPHILEPLEKTLISKVNEQLDSQVVKDILKDLLPELQESR